MQLNSYDDSQSLRRLSKKQFASFASANVFSACSIRSVKGKNRFSLFATADLEDSGPIHFVLATTDNKVASCASIDIAHKWMRDIGITRFSVDAEHWDIGSIYNPHKTSTASRQRHRLLSRLEREEVAILDIIADQAPGNKDDVIGELRDKIQSTVGRAAVNDWLERGTGDRLVLQAGVELALEKSVYPRTEVELALFLRGVSHGASAGVSESEFNALIDDEHWLRIEEKVGATITRKAVTDALILKRGGFQ